MYIRARESEERDEEVRVDTKKAGKHKQNKERKRGKYWEEKNYREDKRGHLALLNNKPSGKHSKLRPYVDLVYVYNVRHVSAHIRAILRSSLYVLEYALI
jgi:hypothetical protein